MDLYDELIMTFYWHPYTHQSYTVVSLVKIATNTLQIAPNYALKLRMGLNYHTYNLQSFIVVTLVNIATKLLNFAPKLGLAW